LPLFTANEKGGFREEEAAFFFPDACQGGVGSQNSVGPGRAGRERDGDIWEEDRCRRLSTDTPGRRRGVTDPSNLPAAGAEGGAWVVVHALLLSDGIREEDGCRHQRTGASGRRRKRPIFE
jgi:hypothetical protein